MKKIYSILLVIIAAMVTLSSCQRDEMAPQNEGKTVHFFAEQIETKTAFGDRTAEGTYPTLWTVNDGKIKIALNAEQQIASVTPSSDFTTASFQATFDGGTAPYTFYALSPESAVQNLTNYKWLLDFPSSQEPLENSVDEAAQVLFAKSSEYETIPVSVPLTFSHLTAYGKLSLTNFTPDTDETISTINLTFEAPVVGRWNYDPTKDPSVESQLTANSPSSTITLKTSSTSDIWFACAPVDMSGKTLDVVVSTNKGTYTKQITFNTPSGNKFEAGKVSVFSVNMTDVSPESSNIYTLVTSISDLTVGSEVIIAAKDSDFAIGTTQNGNNRAAAAITKINDENEIRDPASTVEIFTIEEGNTTGTLAFYAQGNAGYIYAAGGTKKNYLRTKPTKDDLGSWEITIDDSGVATIKAKIEGRNLLQHNTQSPLFSCYSGGQNPVAIYKKASTGDPGKINQTISYETTAFTITYGDSFTKPDLQGVPQTTVKYSSSDPTIATVDENSGDVTINTNDKTGKTTITATAIETSQYYEASASYTLTVLPAGDGDTWTRVTNVPQILSGGTFIIGYEETVASGILVPLRNDTPPSKTILYSGNQAGKSTGGTINMSALLDSTPYEVTIINADTDAVYIKLPGGYVGYDGNGNNTANLYDATTTKYIPTLEDGRFKFTVGTTERILQYNSQSGSERFAHYTSKQKTLTLYKKN